MINWDKSGGWDGQLVSGAPGTFQGMKKPKFDRFVNNLDVKWKELHEEWPIVEIIPRSDGLIPEELLLKGYLKMREGGVRNRVISRTILFCKNFTHFRYAEAT